MYEVCGSSELLDLDTEQLPKNPPPALGVGGRNEDPQRWNKCNDEAISYAILYAIVYAMLYLGWAE